MAAKRISNDGWPSKHLIDTMIELAFRGSEQEALVLRIAKAGEVAEVVKHITRLRLYAKKMKPGVRPPAPARPATRTPVRRQRRQRKPPRSVGAGGEQNSPGEA